MKRVVNCFSLFTLLFSFLFASCIKENNDIGKQIRFEIGFAPQSFAATNATLRTTWEDGDKIGLFAVRHSRGVGGVLAASGNYLHNVALTYIKKTNTWASAIPIYIPGGDELDFYAYYPYDESATDPTNITFNISSDQNAVTGGQPNYNRSDIMLSNSIKNVGSGTPSVSLLFSHVLAMVQISVHKSYADLGEVTATLQGCVTGASGNLSSGKIETSGELQSVKMFRLEQSGDANYRNTYTYRAIVPAQIIDAGKRLFHIKAGDSDHLSPALTEPKFLIGGKVESYSIGQGGSKQLHFDVSIAPQTDPNFETTWEDGDKIGLFAVQHPLGVMGRLDPSDNYLHNEVLTYSKQTNRWSSANPIYLPINGDQLDFYAYYPYDESATDPTNITFNIDTDQSPAIGGQQNYNRSDVMFTNSTKNVDSDTPSVPLTFSHALAMVEVKVAESYAELGEVAATLQGCTTGTSGTNGLICSI